MRKKNKRYSDHDEEQDDFDLVKLVDTNSDDNQFLVFFGINDEFYGINVAKVDEILTYTDIKITHNVEPDSLIFGTASIRGEMVTIIYFDEWAGGEILKDVNYELLVIASFGGYKIGLIVQSVRDIITISSHEMKSNSGDNPKSTFVADVELNQAKEICTIFDGDRLLRDVFGSSDLKLTTNKIASNKTLLYADDSIFVRSTIKEILDEIEGLKYKFFEDGKELLDHLRQSDPDDIGLIITDLEMPRMDGKSLVKAIRDDEKYDDIAVVVHSNLINANTKNALDKLKINKTITKLDAKVVSGTIEELMR